MEWDGSAWVQRQANATATRDDKDDNDDGCSQAFARDKARGKGATLRMSPSSDLICDMPAIDAAGLRDWALDAAAVLRAVETREAGVESFYEHERECARARALLPPELEAAEWLPGCSSRRGGGGHVRTEL